MMRFILSILVLYITFSCKNDIERVEYRSWKNCIKLENDIVEVVINPIYGGQILSYSFKGGENVLWTDTVINGWDINKYVQTRRSPDAGRFDVGYERKTENIHNEIWAGRYDVVEGSRDYLHILSDTCFAMGATVSREFILEKGTSNLTIRQKMTNISDKEIEYCFWTRTLLPAGGVYRARCVVTERYENGFSEISLENDELLDTDIAEDRVKVEDGIFIAYPKGSQKRYGIFTTDGKSEYEYKNVIYLKKCDYIEGGKYENNNSESFPNMIYFNDDFIELEPHSDMRTLNPDESFTYTEIWTLKKR